MQAPFETLVNNVKFSYKDRYQEECTLDDETIFNAYGEWFGVSDYDHPDDPEYVIYDELYHLIHQDDLNLNCRVGG